MRIRTQLDRVRWFLRNYRNIQSNSSLMSNHFLGPVTYDTDSLCTSNNADFLVDSKFISAYTKALETKPWSNFTLQWRVYVVCWFANQVKDLEGDFVECGVNTGAYANAILDYTQFKNLKKTFYLFDTFNGLVKDQITDKELEMGIGKYLNHYNDVYHQVVETFKNLPVNIIKGTVPDTLNECKAAKISYLSIDMNCVLPEIEALTYFWPKIVSGGIIILDDYGFPGHEEQKKAFDTFALNNSVQILSLPTGQGIIIKK